MAMSWEELGTVCGACVGDIVRGPWHRRGKILDAVLRNILEVSV